MGDFGDYLGQYLDSTIVQLAKISSACEIFADKCVLNGYVPPHPGDLQRALKEINWSLISNNTDDPQAQNNDVTNNSEISINNDNSIQSSSGSIESINIPGKKNDISIYMDSIKNVSKEDLELIKELARQQKNALSQFAINKIHKRIPNVSTKEIRNCIRVLISQGEIKVE